MNVKRSLVFQWSVLAYIHICICDREWEKMDTESVETEKTIANFLFRETEEKRKMKKEKRMENSSEKGKRRKKIKSPYDAIYTARMCNVFDWRISIRAHTLAYGGELNMFWTIEHIYSFNYRLLARSLAHTLSFFLLFFSRFCLLRVFLIRLLILYINWLGVKFIHAYRSDSFQWADLTA